MQVLSNSAKGLGIAAVAVWDSWCGKLSPVPPRCPIGPLMLLGGVGLTTVVVLGIVFRSKT